MRYPAIDRNFFITNRNNLKVKLKPGSLAILFSNFQMPRNGDQYFPYRQQSDFFYLTGTEQEKSILLLAPDTKNKELQEILFILKANKTLEIWEGHKLTRDEARNISGISTIKDLEEFDGILHNLCCESEIIYFNLPELAKFLPEVLSADTVKATQIKEKYPLHRFERLAPLLTELRLKKTGTEIELMRKAASITRKAFLSVLSSIKPGMKEYEIEAIITSEFICSGAQGHAYAPIIASGRNACVLHYIENNCICTEGDLLLMDIGAEYANYAADLSRTIPVSGKYSKRQLELYNATLRVFRSAVKFMKPGITINELHEKVCKFWEEEHIRLGLYTKEDIKRHKEKEPLWFGYYMHGTSHFLGLDVHDYGTKEIRLEPGMVLTCEPGIYIAGEGVGIRLENNILITENGNIDLMEDIPIEADEIVQLMRQ
jgi:Xaa-Pro aminopeptidase